MVSCRMWESPWGGGGGGGGAPATTREARNGWRYSIHGFAHYAQHLLRFRLDAAAGQFAGDHADHELFQALHLVVRNVRFVVLAADAGIVGEKQELAAGEQGAGAHHDFARIVGGFAG